MAERRFLAIAGAGARARATAPLEPRLRVIPTAFEVSQLRFKCPKCISSAPNAFHVSDPFPIDWMRIDAHPMQTSEIANILRRHQIEPPPP